MTKSARPATVDDLLAVIKSLNKNNVDYFLIGGYALHSHGYTRGTEDIDILIPSKLTPEEINNLKTAFLILKDHSILTIPNYAFKENLRLVDEIVVDLMTNAGGENYQSLQQYAGSIEIKGEEIKTINLQGLLKTKQYSTREKDKLDCQIITDFLISGVGVE